MDIGITTDMELVKSILIKPEIWERAAEDGIDPETYFPGYDAMTAWLLCKENNENIGIILVHTDTSVSVKIHPYLLEEHRTRGREMMDAFYRWFLKETTVHKICAVIPEHYKKVVNFAKKVGFKQEGFIPESFKKHGHLYGQYYLGITRNQIEERIK